MSITVPVVTFATLGIFFVPDLIVSESTGVTIGLFVAWIFIGCIVTLIFWFWQGLFQQVRGLRGRDNQTENLSTVQSLEIERQRNRRLERELEEERFLDEPPPRRRQRRGRTRREELELELELEEERELLEDIRERRRLRGGRTRGRYLIDDGDRHRREDSDADWEGYPDEPPRRRRRHRQRPLGYHSPKSIPLAGSF